MPPRDVPQHLGEVLTKVLKAMRMSQAELARRTGLSAKHVNQVCKGNAGISAQAAVLLEEVVGEVVEAETFTRQLDTVQGLAFAHRWDTTGSAHTLAGRILDILNGGDR